jgi:hypothetical protein
MFTVYINSNVCVGPTLAFLVSKVQFSDVECWEFRNVEKIERDEYHNTTNLFFSVNDKVQEVRLHILFPSDIVAIYPEN